MPGLKNDSSVSLVLDQDVIMADGDGTMTITLLSPVEDSVRRVTEVQVSSSVCLRSPYLRTIMNIAKVRPAWEATLEAKVNFCRAHDCLHYSAWGHRCEVLFVVLTALYSRIQPLTLIL